MFLADAVSVCVVMLELPTANGEGWICDSFATKSSTVGCWYLRDVATELWPIMSMSPRRLISEPTSVPKPCRAQYKTILFGKPAASRALVYAC